MTTLRTSNRRRARARRRAIAMAAFLEHVARCARLHASGREDKLIRSAWVLRRRNREQVR